MISIMLYNSLRLLEFPQCGHCWTQLTTIATSTKVVVYQDVADFPLSSVHCKVVHYTVYNVHCIVYNIHCIVYNVHCIVYNVHCIVYNVHYTVYNVHCIVYKTNHAMIPRRMSIIHRYRMDLTWSHKNSRTSLVFVHLVWLLIRILCKPPQVLKQGT